MMVAVQVPTIMTKLHMVLLFERSLNTMINDTFDQQWMKISKGKFTFISLYNGGENIDECMERPLYFKNYVKVCSTTLMNRFWGWGSLRAKVQKTTAIMIVSCVNIRRIPMHVFMPNNIYHILYERNTYRHKKYTYVQYYLYPMTNRPYITVQSTSI